MRPDCVDTLDIGLVDSSSGGGGWQCWKIQHTDWRLEIRPEAQLCLYSSLFIVLILSAAVLPQHHKHSYGGNITISPIYCAPVVHEDVRGPDGAGGEPEVLHVPVLSLIPPQVVVRPLLEIATLQILVQF